MSDAVVILSYFPQKATCAVTPPADVEPSTAFPRTKRSSSTVRDLESSLTAGVRPEFVQVALAGELATCIRQSRRAVKRTRVLTEAS